MTMPSRRFPGSHDDPYTERRARIPLVEALATAFPDQDTVKNICEQSLSNPAPIRWDPKPVGTWTAVLDYAVKTGQIDTLLQEAIAVSPEESKVAAAVQHYREARGS